MSRREKMVNEQIAARGIRDQTVLRAMQTVPRHLFVPTVPPTRTIPSPSGTGRPSPSRTLSPS